MTHDPIRLSFKIDAFNPETIPMGRLAEYMADLATMIGERSHVHFVELEAGCVELVHQVDYVAYPKVETRTEDVARGSGTVESLAAYRAINKRLVEDNTFATYRRLDLGSEILRFPGVTAPKPLVVAPVKQPTTIDGIVLRVGGKPEGGKVPVQIASGDASFQCVASVALSKELAGFYLEDERRFHGVGHWHRDEVEGWMLKKLEIQSHEPLDATPLTAIVERLRAIPSDFAHDGDAWAELMKLRGEGEPH